MAGYISKNKADWLFQEIFCDEEYCGGSCYKCGKEVQYRNKLLQEPDADVQPIRRGQWKLTNNPSFRKCSECGAWWSSDITDNCFTNYCPKCGARMDGDANG